MLAVARHFGNVISRLHEVPEADINAAVALAREAKRGGKRFFFIGNGGSAAIASHMAADWLKAGGVKAMAFNDGPLMSCMINDVGYARMFSYPLADWSQSGDVLFAISSSGQSENILTAARVARDTGLNVVTLSGFRPDNPLRRLGDVNFHVASDRYGIVEVCHHAICHAVLDLTVGAP